MTEDFHLSRFDCSATTRFKRASHGASYKSRLKSHVCLIFMFVALNKTEELSVYKREKRLLRRVRSCLLTKVFTLGHVTKFVDKRHEKNYTRQFMP